MDGSDANAAAIQRSTAAPGTAIALRQVQYLNKVVEQEHRGGKWGTRPMLGGQAFAAAQAPWAVRQRRVHYIRAIVIAHCPDANAPAVADSAMMLLLAVTRHLLEADRFVRAGGWQEHWRVETPTITGKRLGLLGLGRIGSRIAQRAARL